VTALDADVVYGACEECEQVSALWRYVPVAHLYEPDSYSCPVCLREVQPLLCGECTAAERAAENARLVSVGEQTARAWFRAAAELDEQRKAS
jgi:hypothetical protein